MLIQTLASFDFNCHLQTDRDVHFFLTLFFISSKYQFNVKCFHQQRHTEMWNLKVNPLPHWARKQMNTKMQADNIKAPNQGYCSEAVILLTICVCSQWLVNLAKETLQSIVLLITTTWTPIKEPLKFWMMPTDSLHVVNNALEPSNVHYSE